MAPQTLIIGSYRRHFEHIAALKASLESNGVTVRAPASDRIVNPGEDFALLESDATSTPRDVQDRIFSLIRASDFVVVANIDGYLGRATTLEIGYAIASGIDVLSCEPIDDPNIAGYVRPLGELAGRSGL